MDGFHTYKKIYQIGHDENKDIFANPDDFIFIEEKIDGGNFRFIIRNGKVIFGSRTQQLTDDYGNDTNVSKQFRKCVEFVRNKIETILATRPALIHDMKLNNFIFYGENCIKHTLDYDWYRMPVFLGFDVFDMLEDRFLSYYEARHIFGIFDLDFVPLVKECKAGEITEINDAMVPISEYAPISNPTQQAEGIVFKNYTNQIFAKYVRNEFKEKNAEAFGGNPKYNKDTEYDDAEFVFKYCTNARIEKNVFKLIDEGHKLEMSMMTVLPHRVYDDIVDENWKEIFQSNWKLDIPNIRRKLIAKRCASILNQIITNNAR